MLADSNQTPSETPTKERKHPLALCEECPLYERGRYVPSSWHSGRSDVERPTSARMAFIGESPNKTEVAKGKVFIGAGGQLLGQALAEHGVKLEEVFLTNATGCHYPDSMKKLPDAAIECCRPRLLAELEESGAKTVVPMGNSAIKAVFPKEIAKQGITRLRAGRPKTSALLPSVAAVVPSFHPSACLRAQEKWPLMLTDIGKGVSADNLPELWYEPEIVILNDGNSYEAMRQLDRILSLNRGELVEIDIETGREKDKAFGNAHLEQMLCIGIGPSDPFYSDTVFVFGPECFKNKMFLEALREFLDSVQIDAQNGKFDNGSLRSMLGYKDFELPLLAEDTMLQSYTLFEYAGVHGLEYMGMELLGTPDWKHVIEPYLRGPDGKGEVDYANVPLDLLFKYNAFDVHATRLLHKHFSAQIKARGLENGYRFCIRVSNMLTLVESRGIGFDLHYSAELAASLQRDKAELELQLPIVSDPEAKGKKLREPHLLNPDSPTQVTKYLSDNGVKVDTTEADVLEGLLAKYEVRPEVKETIRIILAIRGITKTDGTFVTGMAKRVTDNGTVHPSFLIHGTTSGRLSARNPNSQNIKRAKEIKRQFIASRSGNVLVGVDMSQAELRVLAWLAKDEGLREIFNDPDRDLFVELCRMMFSSMFEGKSFAEVKNDPIRPLVKGAVYGLAYGRTAAGIAADPEFDMTVKEAQDVLDKLSLVIPEVIRFLDEAVEKVMNLEDLVTPFGRHRRFHLITFLNERSVANEAKSFPAQSIASDIVLEAAWRLTFIHHVPIVNLVHDAIYADVPEEEAETTAALISKVMIEVAEEVTEGYVKFATEGKIGNSWADV